ncbi:MAG: hypothetical protein V7L22_25760 [Nostoc sp.]|uniref:hypothetical protein n=1 Tax=Nostoc sp. TaxID=1180 RepID=UPI002FFB37B7
MDHPVFSKDDDRLKPSVIQSGQNRGKNPNSTELNTLAMRRSSCDSNFSFPRLEGTHTEATNILSLVPKSSSKSAFDFDVNRTTVMNPATSTKRLQIYRTLLKVIAHKAVSDRPGRSEPRVRKRRPKAYPLMTKPRHELRKQLQTA